MLKGRPCPTTLVTSEPYLLVYVVKTYISVCGPYQAAAFFVTHPILWLEKDIGFLRFYFNENQNALFACATMSILQVARTPVAVEYGIIVKHQITRGSFFTVPVQRSLSFSHIPVVSCKFSVNRTNYTTNKHFLAKNVLYVSNTQKAWPAARYAAGHAKTESNETFFRRTSSNQSVIGTFAIVHQTSRPSSSTRLSTRMPTSLSTILCPKV